MDTKALLYGLIGFFAGGLLVSVAATYPSSEHSGHIEEKRWAGYTSHQGASHDTYAADLPRKSQYTQSEAPHHTFASSGCTSLCMPTAPLRDDFAEDIDRDNKKKRPQPPYIIFASRFADLSRYHSHLARIVLSSTNPHLAINAKRPLVLRL